MKWFWDRAVAGWIPGQAVRCIAVSEADRSLHLVHGIRDERISIIPNGLDLAEFESLPNPKAFRERYGLGERPVVAYLGQISPRKGVEHLVAAFSPVGPAGAVLVIGGNDMGGLKRAQRVSGPDIVFTGLLRGTERLELLAAADVLVYASKTEVFGLVPFEGLLCGAPVVVADDCGCGELIAQAGAGLLVRYGDVTGLRARVETLLGDPVASQAMVQRGQRYIQEQLGFERVAGMHHELYQENVERPVHDSQLNWRLVWVLSLVLIWWTWSGDWYTEFVYDDTLMVLPLQGRSIWSFSEWVEYNSSRIVVVWSYLFDYGRAGEPVDLSVFHRTSLWLHILACGAGLFMAESLGRLSERRLSLRLGAAAVVLWSIHPMVSQPLIYLSGRADILVGLFLFLNRLLVHCAPFGTGSGRARWQGLDVAGCGHCFLYGCHWFQRNRNGGTHCFGNGRVGHPDGCARALVETGAMALLGNLFGLIAFGVGLRLRQLLLLEPDEWTGGLFGDNNLWSGVLPEEVERDAGVQITTSANVWRRYVGLWLIPDGLAIRHGQPDLSPGSAEGFMAITLWLGLMGVSLWAWIRHRLVGLALLLGALSLVPSTSVVPLHTHMAEHRAYILGLFLLLGLAWSIPVQWTRRGQGLAVVLGLCLVFLSRAQAENWKSPGAIWAHAVDNAVAEGEADDEVGKLAFQAGTLHRLNGDMEKAAVQLQLAIDHADTHHTVMLEDGEHGLLYASWNEMGILRAQLGDADGATAAFLEAQQIEPTSCRAHNNLGGLLYEMQNLEGALNRYLIALQYCDDDSVTLYMLGKIYYHKWKKSQRDREAFLVQDAYRDRSQGFLQRLELVDPQFRNIEEVKSWLFELTFHQ